MSANGLLRKDQLERSLHDEKKLIEEGILKEDNPLDFSENFQRLCAACRRGDLKVCQEMIQEGANINAKDQYDYTPLILVSRFIVKATEPCLATFPFVSVTNSVTCEKASLCGHYEVVQLLLESGALCERDTFQGERCCPRCPLPGRMDLADKPAIDACTMPLTTVYEICYYLTTIPNPPTHCNHWHRTWYHY